MAKTTTDEPLREAAMPFAYTGEDGLPKLVRGGAKLRHDHEAVRLCPAFFCDAGLPDDEKPDVRDFVQPGEQARPRENRPSSPGSRTRGLRVSG